MAITVTLNKIKEKLFDFSLIFFYNIYRNILEDIYEWGK